MKQNVIENIEAERAVIGSILLEGDLIHECTLTPEHFSQHIHQRIFGAMCKVEDGIDLVTVVTKLGDELTQVGGINYLSKLAESIASTASFSSYQRLVFESYRLREVRRLSSAFAVEPSDDKINDMYQRIGELQEIGLENSRTKQDVLFEIYNDIETDQGEMTGTDTGFADLNNMTGGLQDSDLIIVAARPSMGKTALALNLAMNAAQKDAVADIFSLEMSDKQLTQRLLSAIGNINGSKWRNPHRFFNDDDYGKWTQSSGVYSNLDLYIHDDSRQTVADIRANVRKTAKDHPGQKHLVVIDYLQLITPIGRSENKNVEVGAITRELKQMARAFDLPVVLLSQLSRGVESRQDKHPMMSDLRDSGSIEADADMVILLYRDDYYNRDSESKNIVDLDIAKQRNGPVGTVELAFSKEYGKFLNLSRGEG